MRQYDIETFLKAGSKWGLVSNNTSLTDEVRAQCSHWVIEVRLRDGEKASVNIYHHGEKPTDNELQLLNREVADFYYELY